MALLVLPAGAGETPSTSLAGSVQNLGAMIGDSVRSEQWQLNMLNAERAWTQSTGSGVVVAVIDSGVKANHPDLSGQVLPGKDFVDSAGDGTNDAAGHGTTVAALIAGSDADDQGVVGLAPDAKILPIRVLDAKNEYKDPQLIAEAVVWAVDHGAKVINLSLGSQRDDRALADAIDYAFARDVVVVACVGNLGPGSGQVIWHPAREPGVIAVGAVTSDAKLWKQSLVGKETVLVAPGYNLLGARPNGYAHVGGTSFASPLVAASAALVRSRYPRMSAANVIQRLISTAKDEGSQGRDTRFGFGIVDPAAALTATVPEVITNPLDTTPPPGNAAFGSADASPSPSVSASARFHRRVGPGAPTPPMRPLGMQPSGEQSPHSPMAPVWLAAALGGFALLVAGAFAFLRRV